MRWAAATARWAWAMSMPVMRSGTDQHDDVGVEGDELAEREVAVDHLVAAVPEDGEKPERRQEVEQRHEPGPDAGRR